MKNSPDENMVKIALFFEEKLGFFKNKSLRAKIIISVILGVVVAFGGFYFFLPPLNLMSERFWLYVLAITAAACVPFIKVGPTQVTVKNAKGNVVKKYSSALGKNKWIITAVAIPLGVLVLGNIISSTVFNARSYANIIKVTESSFTTDLPETNEITNIALMDTESAKMLGNRTLGSLSNVVSQYTVSDVYTQINYKNTPKKVSNLEYDGFFKWIGNRENGIPGVVLVDPVKSSDTVKGLPFFHQMGTGNPPFLSGAEPFSVIIYIVRQKKGLRGNTVFSGDLRKGIPFLNNIISFYRCFNRG